MNYELAKQLKTAGFEQSQSHTGCPNCPCIDNDVYYPTLSELIEACGNEFLQLGKYKMSHGKKGKFLSWIAGSVDTEGWQWQCKGEGDTPEEAVAKLWLQLNK